MPLVYEPGVAFQFDWSEDWANICGERVKLQVAHIKLSHSRAFLVRAYPLQTHEMLFDAHWHAPRAIALFDMCCEERGYGRKLYSREPTVAGDKNCSEFASSAAAQKFFLISGGPTKGRHGLDKLRCGFHWSMPTPN